MTNLKTLLVLSSLALTLSACSSDSGSGKPQSIRTCSNTELAAFSDVFEAGNNRVQLRRACSSYFRVNSDMSSCAAVTQQTIRTNSGVYHPGETVSLSPEKLREVCDQVGGQNGGHGPQLPREDRDECSREFVDLFADAVRNTSHQTCNRFQDRFDRRHDCRVNGKRYEASSVYEYCRKKLRR